MKQSVTTSRIYLFPRPRDTAEIPLSHNCTYNLLMKKGDITRSIKKIISISLKLLLLIIIYYIVYIILGFPIISESLEQPILFFGWFLILIVFSFIMYIFIFKEIDKTEVLPFSFVGCGERDGIKLDGKAISDSIIAELYRISIIHNAKFDESEAERLPVPMEKLSETILSEEFRNIDNFGNNIAMSLGEVGRFSMAGLDLPIGPVMLALYRLRRIGKEGCLIQGSLRVHDDTADAMAQITHYSHSRESSQRSFLHRDKLENYFCQVSGSADDLTKLIKELSFEIVYLMYKHPIKGSKNKSKEKGHEEDRPSMNISKNLKFKEFLTTEIFKNNIDQSHPSTNFDWIKFDYFLNGKSEIKILETDINNIEKYIESLNKSYKISKGTCAERNNWYFDSIDIQDPKGLAEKLCPKGFIEELSRHRKSPISKYIKDQDSTKNFCKSLARYKNTQPFDEINLREKLTENLNKLLDELKFEKISQIFQDKNLSMEAKNIVKKEKCNKSEPSIHLNRLLIEDLFPEELKSRPSIESPKGLHFLTETLESYYQYNRTKKRDCLDEATDNCTETYKLEKNNKILYVLFYNLGAAYFAISEYKKAEELFRTATELARSKAGGYSAWGFSLRYLLHYKDAIDAAEKAICCESILASPWYLLGGIYLDLGCYASDLYDKSIACYYEAIRREHSSPYPWLWMGVVFYRKAALNKKYIEVNNKLLNEIFGEDVLKINSWKIYNGIALTCIEKSINLAMKHGPKKFPLSPFAKAACLLQRSEDSSFSENLQARRILLNPLEKDPYNRACIEALSGITEAAKNAAKDDLEDALKNERISRVGILFDPDFEKIKGELENFFESQMDRNRRQKEKKIFKEIKEILLNKEEDEYIRASFAAVCGDKIEAINLLKEAFEKHKDLNPLRFKIDPHFENIQNIAVVASGPDSTTIGCDVEIIIVVFNTSEGPIDDIRVTLDFPDGISYKFTGKKESGMVNGGCVKTLEKKWVSNRDISFIATIGRVEYGDLKIKVNARGIRREDKVIVENSDTLFIEILPAKK
jgi:tetratricopeptide (TPR) repeat protein